MFRNYFKTAFRNLVRHKLFTGLNVFGLATGMACSILIFLWVQDELSYDKFNAHADRIYRMTAKASDINAAVVPIPIAAAVKAEIPAIAEATRLSVLQSIVTIGTKKFDEKNIYYADSNFLHVFSYPLLKGDAATALRRPDGIVLTENTAKKYFGSVENVLGKTLHIDNDYKGNNLVVTGILKNIPHNSHLQFDMLLPIYLYDKDQDPLQAWGNYDVYTYVQFDNHFNASAAALKAVEKQINAIHEKRDNTNTKSVLSLQPLTSIHLHSHFILDVAGPGNNQYVTIFSLVAVFILLIACINFMNLSTALSGQRAKEVGLRKTVGALRWQLITQFISESLLLSFISLLIGIVLAWALLPLFNELASKSILINLLNIKIIATLLCTAVIVGLISGSYPALFLSSFNPVKVLKGVKTLHGKTFFRNGLVVLQFSISVILMVSTLVVYNQLRFIRNRDIGFNKENLLYVQMPPRGDMYKTYALLKSTLSRYPGIKDYSVISHLPTNLATGTKLNWPGMNPEEQVISPQLFTDENFIHTFGMQLIAGRFFSKEFKGDDKNYVVNETALKIMKMDVSSAVGKKITLGGDLNGEIIGVIRDFNFKPVQQPIEPLILRKYDGWGTGSAGYLVIRTTPANMRNIIGEIKKAFEETYAGFPFSYGFVNEDLSKLYLTEQQMGKLFNVFSIISIIVSCLGLFGLATFATQKRIKEIGVRKVLGASEAGIVAMLSKDFIKLVIVALVVAFPASWWIMNKWLDNFAYRIDISWWVFAISGVLAIFIAFATVSYQSIRAALMNPVKSLRTE